MAQTPVLKSLMGSAKRSLHQGWSWAWGTPRPGLSSRPGRAAASPARSETRQVPRSVATGKCRETGTRIPGQISARECPEPLGAVLFPPHSRALQEGRILQPAPGSGDAAANLGDPTSWPAVASSPNWSRTPVSPALPTGYGRDEVSGRGSRVVLGQRGHARPGRSWKRWGAALPGARGRGSLLAGEIQQSDEPGPEPQRATSWRDAG